MHCYLKRRICRSDFGNCQQLTGLSLMIDMGQGQSHGEELDNGIDAKIRYRHSTKEDSDRGFLNNRYYRADVEKARKLVYLKIGEHRQNAIASSSSDLNKNLDCFD